MEVRGHDRAISVDSRGCYYVLPWNSASFHGKRPGSWHVHGKVHGCGCGTCRGSARGKHRRTNHGNARKYAAMATELSSETAMVISTDIRGHYHGNTAISTEVRDTCHGCFHGRPTETISTAFRGSPWPLPRESSYTRRLPRKSAMSAGIAKHVQRFYPWQTNHAHSAAIATAFSEKKCCSTEVRMSQG